MPLYSVVIPLKNEESNILQLIKELEPVMENLGDSWELICIDDGSTDSTRDVIRGYSKGKSHIQLIAFDRNYGQSSAFDAGFKAAKGLYVITMDGDGQNDPADIPAFLPYLEKYDLICGIRQKRKDSWSKRVISKVVNRIRKWICDDGVQDTGCSLKVFNKKALDEIKMYDGLHRFLPALFKIEGFSVFEIPVNHRPRLGGKSNYNLINRSFNTVADLLAVNWMSRRHLRYKQTKHSI